jgi:RNA polymerase sigma-70 factor, ECF subfamily
MSAVTASLDRAGTAARPGVPAVPADDVLVVGLRLRDENAYLELVRRHTPLMLRVARSILGSAEAAEDVVQDTWVAVVRSVDGFEGRSTFKTWLMRILVNTARSRRGREARTVCWSTQPADAPVWDAVLARRSAEAAGPLDHAIAVEAWEVIRTALAGLPDRQRVVVVLRDVEGSTSEEVRALLGLSVGNQRVLLHRGRARLRVLLGPGAVDAVGA